jgi:hypothetical protein
MKSNFQAGVNTVYNAVVAKGVTPASKTPSAIATAIGNLPTIVYAESVLSGQINNQRNYTQTSGGKCILVQDCSFYNVKSVTMQCVNNRGFNLYIQNSTTNSLIGAHGHYNAQVDNIPTSFRSDSASLYLTTDVGYTTTFKLIGYTLY